MTIRVKITHDQPGDTRKVRLTLEDLYYPTPAVQAVAPPAYVPAEVHTLEPGETKEFYIHSGRRISVSEIA